MAWRQPNSAPQASQSRRRSTLHAIAARVEAQADHAMRHDAVLNADETAFHQMESVDPERQYVVRRLRQADRPGGEIDPQDAP
jgi:hypothetical protein